MKNFAFYLIVFLSTLFSVSNAQNYRIFDHNSGNLVYTAIFSANDSQLGLIYDCNNKCVYRILAEKEMYLIQDIKTNEVVYSVGAKIYSGQTEVCEGDYYKSIRRVPGQSFVVVDSRVLYTVYYRDYGNAKKNSIWTFRGPNERVNNRSVYKYDFEIF